ncbi:PcfJ domain-containing protein [Enterococcus wangshanyuanii]|nr:PcfJ domain-containing protein [Enterococcus wangshanyuanii]
MKKSEWYIENALKPRKTFFDWCYSQIHTFKWSNKQQTILASDRKNCEVIEKRLTKRTNLTFFDKFYAFCVVLVTAKRVEIQTYCFWSNIENGKQKIKMELSNLERFSNDEYIQIGKWWNEYTTGLTPILPMGGAYTGVTNYEDDWKERIQTISELRYIDFSQAQYFDRHDIGHVYKYRKEIEFLQKIKATTIASQLMRDHEIDYRVFNQNWLKANKSILKNSSLTFDEFELERRIRNRNGKVVQGIDQYLSYKDIKHIPKGVGIVKFQNWVIKKAIDFQYYHDYITMLSDIGKKADTLKTIIPDDLREAHDEALKVYLILEPDIKKRKKALKDAKERRRLEKEERENEIQFKRRLRQIRKYETIIDGYAFVVPKKLEDIVNEGKMLSHCVGNSRYLSEHRDGETTIVFVRKEQEKERPLCTLEYKDGQIAQLQGYKNQEENVPEGVKKASDKWLEWVKQKNSPNKNRASQSNKIA